MTLRERTEAFLAFVRSQPPEETYYPGSISRCALARFNQAVKDDPRATAGGSSICPDDSVGGRLTMGDWPESGWTGFCWDGTTPDRTFAELAAHLQAHLDATSATASSP